MLLDPTSPHSRSWGAKICGLSRIGMEIVHDGVENGLQSPPYDIIPGRNWLDSEQGHLVGNKGNC